MVSAMAPTVRRIQLGRELERLRVAAGVSRPDAAAAIGCSEARIGHIETGRNAPSKSDLVVLVVRLYGVDEATLDALEELREEASQRGWWSTYRLPKWLAGYVGLEADAASLRCLNLEIIPGLLQTEQYMRRFYALADLTPAKDIDRHVRARLHRQDRLSGPDALQLSAVVSEGALVRCVRDRGIAGAQLAQLLERATWPNIELRVLPFDWGLHAGTGPFTLLTFPDHLLPDAAYQEYAVGGHIIDDESVVARLATLFDELRDQSLDADESLAMITQLANHRRE
jgi:transcriptional regulator with XRE-family HTH domain